MEEPQISRTDAKSLYRADDMRATTAAVIRGKDPTGPPPQDAVAETDRVMDWLRRAVAAGFDNATRLKRDRASAALRDRADFAALLAAVADTASKRSPER